MTAKRGYIFVPAIAFIVVSALIVGAVFLFNSSWFQMDNRPTLPSSPNGTEPPGLGTQPTYPANASGVDGIGDDYLPHAGGTGYQVIHYDIDVEVDPVSHFIWGVTELEIEALGPLEVIHLDIAQSVTETSIAGQSVPFTQDGVDLAIRIPEPSTPRAKFSVRVEYNGGLSDLPADLAEGIYLRVGDVLIAGEPESCAIWFACNDHPSDPATFRVTARVPHDVEAISSGTWISTTPEDSWDTWVFEIDSPTVTYAVPLAVGQYKIDLDEVEVGGKTVQYFSAASESGTAFGAGGTDGALAYLRRSVASATHLTTYLGEYPLETIGGILPPMSLSWGALETSGRPVYDPSCARNGGWNAVLLHEISHFWFGDKVTLAAWHDIVINEGMATYLEQYLAPGKDRQAADALFYDEFNDTSPGFWTSALSNPGPGDQIFSNHVYAGGALAIHATRVLMGDDAFFEFLNAWAAQTGPHSLADWRIMTAEYSPVDLATAHSIWFDGTTRVTCTPAVGCP